MTGTEFIEMQQSRRNPWQGETRIQKINKLATENGTTTDRVTVVINQDPRWNQRCTRTAAERTAVKVGQTNSTLRGYPEEIVWAYIKG